MKPEKQRGVL